MRIRSGPTVGVLANDAITAATITPTVFCAYTTIAFAALSVAVLFVGVWMMTVSVSVLCVLDDALLDGEIGVAQEGVRTCARRRVEQMLQVS